VRKKTVCFELHTPTDLVFPTSLKAGYVVTHFLYFRISGNQPYAFSVFAKDRQKAVFDVT
jgi:hypothetical protein